MKKQKKSNLVDTSDIAILQKWLDFNRRMAGQQREILRRKKEEEESHVKVRDLKAIWEKLDV